MTTLNHSYNITSHDHCHACTDTGWVTLAGTLHRHGYTYSRGTAACKWCEEGTRRYKRLHEQRQHPLNDFDLPDIEGWGELDAPAPKDYALQQISNVRDQWTTPRPVELP